MMHSDIDWEPPASRARGTCDDCGRRRVVFEDGLCLPCAKERDARYEEERELAHAAASGFFDVLYKEDRTCYFEFDGPGDDPNYCLEHLRYCAP